MVASTLKFAFVGYQAASLAAAAVIFAQRPLDVALGALALGLPAFLIWRAVKASRARRASRERVTRRLG
jgi:hypothetical protein